MPERLEIISEDEKTILREIVNLYDEHTHDLGIKKLVYKDNLIHILLSRPGLLIGQKGKDINGLTEILKIRLDNPNLKIHIEESTIDFLVDFPPLPKKGE